MGRFMGTPTGWSPPADRCSQVRATRGVELSGRHPGAASRRAARWRFRSGCHAAPGPAPRYGTILTLVGARGLGLTLNATSVSSAVTTMRRLPAASDGSASSLIFEPDVVFQRSST